jgi:hypothetical protein
MHTHFAMFLASCVMATGASDHLPVLAVFEAADAR